MRNRKLLERARNSPHNFRFNDLCALAKAFGFELRRITGSHHEFKHPSISERLNIQPDKGKAKSYQVMQLLKIVESNNLELP